MKTEDRAKRKEVFDMFGWDPKRIPKENIKALTDLAKENIGILSKLAQEPCF